MEEINNSGQTFDQWVESFSNRPLWTLAEALFWIATRDSGRVAECLWMSPDCFYQGGATLIEHMVRHASLGQGESVGPRPFVSLQASLQVGGVTASGLYHLAPPRQTMPVEVWADLELSNGVRFAGERVCAVPRRRGQIFHSDMDMTGTWADVMFDRLSVIAEFPAIALVATDDHSGNGESSAALRPFEQKEELFEDERGRSLISDAAKLVRSRGKALKPYTVAGEMVRSGGVKGKRYRPEVTRISVWLCRHRDWVDSFEPLLWPGDDDAELTLSPEG